MSDMHTYGSENICTDLGVHNSPILVNASVRKYA